MDLYKKSKYFLDPIIALIAYVCLIPLVLVLMILIKLESRGPIFFRAKRQGMGGKEFYVYKFRTMTINEFYKDSKFATRNDARLTRLGVLLRRTGLDEIPLLINVIKGDMSIVSYKPLHKYERKIFGAEFLNTIDQFKPGLISPIPQMRPMAEEEVEYFKEMIMHYLTRLSLWLDIKILNRHIYNLITGNRNKGYV